MTLIDLPSGRIGLSFRHKPFDKPTLNTDMCKRFMNGYTKCDIYRVDGVTSVLAASGVGVAKWPDPFCKALGRKQALTSALRQKKELGPSGVKIFDKLERELIWDAYWKSIQIQEQMQPPPKVDVNGNSMEAEG